MKPSAAKQINDLIENRDSNALNQLKALETCAFQDNEHRTPFNTAIAVNFMEVIEYLVGRTECLEFFPEIDIDLKFPVKHNIENMEGTTLYLENYFSNSFGYRMSWERTPLLQACRYQHKAAIELLIKAGAKLDNKDILRKNCLELCLDMGGQEMASYFLDICNRLKKKCKITDSLLLKSFETPEFYATLCKQNLDADAKRLVFNLACAYLDIDKVKHLLAQGWDLSKMFKHFSNPVIEACTSNLLYVHRLPNYKNLAHLFAREEVSSPQPNADTAEEEYLALLPGDEQRKTFLAGHKSWQKEVAKLYQRRRTANVSSEELNHQLELRLQLLDILFNAGATAALTEKFYSYYYPEFFFCMGEIKLLERLQQYDLKLEPGASEKTDLIEELQKRNLPHVVDFINQLFNA